MVVALVTALVFSNAVHHQTALAANKPIAIRGMTVSSHTWGVEWNTPAMEQTLDELRSLGVNHVAIHPYAQVCEDGHIIRHNWSSEPALLAPPLEWARTRGLGVMLIPHIAYWGTKFSWRGAIDYTEPEEWDRFFEDYQTWIVGLARVAEAHKVGLFCVGLEFTHAQKFEARWRQIIAAVRAVYHGKLTYGGNWDSYQEVQFYDALDYVGVLAYFPLTRTPDPSEAEILAGWHPYLDALKKMSAQVGKPFLFVEVGYNESARAASDPWDFPQVGSNGQEVQLRCLEAALRVARDEPDLAGLFFWKWYPVAEREPKETFDLRTRPVRDLLRKYWNDRPVDQPFLFTPSP